jgi:hypothetical protein
LKRVMEPVSVEKPNASSGWESWLVDPRVVIWEVPSSGDIFSGWDPFAGSFPSLGRSRH